MAQAVAAEDLARLYLGTAVALEADLAIREPSGGGAEDASQAGRCYDVGVAAAVLGASGRAPGVLVCSSPGPGVLHLYGRDLARHLELRRLDDRPPAALARTGGPACPEPFAGTGLLTPDASAGIAAQIAAGIAFANRRLGGGRTATIQPRPALATGAWHEALSFSAATRSSLVIVVEPVGDLDPEERAFYLAEARRAYGTGFLQAEAHPLATYAAAREALARASSEGRAQLVELSAPEAHPDGELARLRRYAERFCREPLPDWDPIAERAESVVARADGRRAA